MANATSPLTGASGSHEPPRKIMVLVGRAMVAFERVFFPFVFLLYAYATLMHFFKPLDAPVLGKDTPFAVSTLFFRLLVDPGAVAPGTTALHAYALFGQTVIRPLVLLFFEIMCAAFILLRRGIRYTPTSIGEVVLPLLGTFMAVLLPLSSRVGELGRPFVIPDQWLVPMFALGSLLGLAGAALSLYALSYLRLNFSVFVEVRQVVLAGPYRYVRHPMYLGEIAMVLGLVLTQLSPFSVMLFAGLVVCQYLRARMEQHRLAQASPEYTRNMAMSGMFFPRLTRPARRS